MSIPADPSLSDICTEGLKRGGRVNPSAGDITTAQTIWAQEVKSDIYLKAPRHYSLITQFAQGTTVGVSRYNWQTECEAMRSIVLIDAPTDGFWSGTAQGGGANSITLASGFTSDTLTMQGRFVFIGGGTGAGQYAQIISYNDSTKQATIEQNWSALKSTWVQPDSTSKYVVETYRKKLWDYSKPWGWDYLRTPYTPGTPTWATLDARQFWLDYAPDRLYVIFTEYWLALDQLDETSPLFTAHLRKFRNLWTQGVACKVLQRYDEDRYQLEMGIYNEMLNLYGTEAGAVGQVTFRDY